MRMGGVLYWRILAVGLLEEVCAADPGGPLKKCADFPRVLTKVSDVHIHLPVPACLSPPYMPTGH
jgi:hypothetical protein